MGTKIQKSYTLQEKEHGIVTAHKLGCYAKAARLIGVPQTTLKQWVYKQDEGDQGESRRLARGATINACWAAAFKGLLKVNQAMEILEIDPKTVTLHDLLQWTEVVERNARALKHIGAVSTQHEVHGAIDHRLTDGRPITPQLIQEIGKEHLLTEGSKRN